MDAQFNREINDISTDHCHHHRGIKAESMEGPRYMHLPVGWHSPSPGMSHTSSPELSCQERADLTEGYCYHHPSSPSSEGAVFHGVCRFGWGEDQQEDEEVAVVGLRVVLFYSQH